MIVTHPVLRRFLKRIKLSEDQVPTLEQWHAILQSIDKNNQDADQAQYLNELSINVSSREMAEKNKELTESITKLNKLQQQVIQSEKMATIGQLSGGIAHEINNPLSYALANISTLQKRLLIIKNLIDLIKQKLNVTGDHHLHDLVKELDAFIQEKKVLSITTDLDPLLNETNEGLLRIKNIVEAFSKFSNSNIGKMETVDVNNCINSAIAISNTEFNGKLELDLHLEALPSISGVYADLEVTFINLLANAKQAIVDNGKITISSTTKDADIIITFSDNGVGITQENIDKVFDPFFSTRPIGSGIGLGLTMAYGIIENHGGKIWVESKPNEGTSFIISLPIKTQTGL
jgi:two-component system, NtrC family, sensor kinase